MQAKVSIASLYVGLDEGGRCEQRNDMASAAKLGKASNSIVEDYIQYKSYTGRMPLLPSLPSLSAVLRRSTAGRMRGDWRLVHANRARG